MYDGGGIGWNNKKLANKKLVGIVGQVEIKHKDFICLYNKRLLIMQLVGHGI